MCRGHRAHLGARRAPDAVGFLQGFPGAGGGTSVAPAWGMARVVPGGLALHAPGRDEDETSKVQRLGTAPREDPRVPFDAAVAMHQLGQYRTALELLAPFFEC